jgi:hypothetical protein
MLSASQANTKPRGEYRPPLLLLPGMFTLAGVGLLVLTVLSFGVILYPLFLLVPVMTFEFMRRLIWRGER